MANLFRMTAIATLIAGMSLRTGMAMEQNPLKLIPSTTRSDTDNAAKDTSAPKKKKPAKLTRQQEIDKSIGSGTAPARFRQFGAQGAPAIYSVR